jgi:hypothetical protein
MQTILTVEWRDGAWHIFNRKCQVAGPYKNRDQAYNIRDEMEYEAEVVEWSECKTPTEVEYNVRVNFPDVPDRIPFPPGPLYDAYKQAFASEETLLMQSEATIAQRERQRNFDTI